MESEGGVGKGLEEAEELRSGVEVELGGSRLSEDFRSDGGLAFGIVIGSVAEGSVKVTGAVKAKRGGQVVDLGLAGASYAFTPLTAGGFPPFAA